MTVEWGNLFTVEQAKKGRETELCVMDQLSIAEVIDALTATKRSMEYYARLVRQGDLMDRLGAGFDVLLNRWQGKKARHQHWG